MFDISLNFAGLFQGCFKSTKKKVINLDETVFEMLNNIQINPEFKLKFILVKIMENSMFEFGAINAFGNELKNIASVNMSLTESALYNIRVYPITKKSVLVGNIILGSRTKAKLPLLDDRLYEILKKLL